MPEQTTRERWEAWEKATGYEREKKGREGKPKAEPEVGREWAKKKIAATVQHAPSGKISDKTRASFEEAVKAGKVKGNVEEHVRDYETIAGKHHEGLQRELDTLNEIAPKGSVVMGRVKEIDSAVEKLTRKPDLYDRVSKLGDMTGLRVIAPDVKGVEHTVAEIKKRYKVVEEDDAISKPKGAYRSYHLNVVGPDGLQKEIQVRTPGQHSHAEWAHDTYKPRTEAQRLMVREKKHALEEYAKKTSDWFYARERGQDPGPKPECPEEFHSVFGCI